MFLRKKPKPTSTDRQAEPTRKVTQKPRTKPSLLSLEPRLMFDAAAAATAAEVQSEQVAQGQAEAAVSSEAAGDDQTTEQNESQNLLQAIATYHPGESRTEVVFVDPTVPDCQTLAAGIGPNAEVIWLDPTRDGVEQIAESLAGRSGIDAIHLISHGSSGKLQLGVGTLTAESMSGEYADELATIQEALSDQADILVYGCDFAEGQDGQEAATLLSQLTGADVAASTDATGFAGLGGDWVLEAQMGAIETHIAVDDGVQANWIGLLAGETPPTISNLSGDNRAYSEGAGAVVIESGNALVADVDSTNLDTGTLTVSIPTGGDSAEDVLSIRHQGTGAAQIGVSGSTVTYGGTTIGTFAGGSSGSDLVITLNSNATPTAVTALVRNITYQNTDTHAPTTGARTVRFVLTDGDGGTSPNYDTTVTVSAVNDAPVLANTALSLTVAEDAGGPSGAVGSLVSALTGGITDGDSGASKGIAITGRNQTNGTWYYTTNGGSTWTVVGAVSNTSALLLADNGSTRLYFAPNANYTGTSSAALTVRAWDQTSGTAGTKVSTASNGGTTAFSSATDTVDVTVTAANNAPTDLALSANTVAENAVTGTVVGTVSGTDPDAGDTVTYSLTDNAGGRFAINSSTGVITVADGALLDYESTPSHNVIVRVTDAGGLTYDETFTINLTNVNEAPTDLALSANTVAENAATGTVVGTVSGADPDAGDTVTYSLTDNAGGRFAINSSTGVITVADGALLNYEATTSHMITVRVMDAGGLNYDKSFTIILADAYEPLPLPNVPGTSRASHSMVTHENGMAFSSLFDEEHETGKVQFRPLEDLRKAIEITTESSQPADTANLEGKHLGIGHEEFLEKAESNAEETELSPAQISENKTKGKVTAQDHKDSTSLASDHGEFQHPDRTTESVIGTAMAVGLAGVVLHGAVGTKEKLSANVRRPRVYDGKTSLNMEPQSSSEDGSRSRHNESEHDGPISDKPGTA